MNKYETNKMNSFLLTEEVMNRNNSIWSTDEVIKNQFSVIQIKLPMVNQYHQDQKENGNSSSTTKKGTKNNLIDTSVMISASAVSYAAAKKDLNLENSVKLNKSSLNHLTQISLYDVLNNFYKKVLTLKGSLRLLEEGSIEKMDQLLKDFKKSIPQPGADSTQSQTATLNIGESIKLLNEMFKTLDKHIAPYKYSNPDFFNSYTTSRKVINLRGKKKQAVKAA